MAERSRDNNFQVIDGGRRDDAPSDVTIERSTYGGSGGGEPPVDPETKNYLDANLRAERAVTDAEFTKVTTALDTLSTKIDGMPRPIGFWPLAGMGATGIIAIVTILGIMADRFDGGIAARGVMDVIVEQQKSVDVEQNARLQRILEAMEAANSQHEDGPEQGAD